jgi:flagellin FlaB
MAYMGIFHRQLLMKRFTFDTTRIRTVASDQQGVTGLETAIILIAFVVVASVFAFTVLSSGIFSAERGKETVFSSLREARGSAAIKGSVVANGLTRDTLSLANSAWTGETNVTATADATDKKEGTASADLLVATAFTTGLAASEDISSTDLTGQTQVQFWVKSSTTTVAGQIELVLDETAGCGSPEAQMDMPALTAGTWTDVTLAISDSAGNAVSDTNKDGVQCVGIEIEVDLSTLQNETVNLDRVLASGMIESLDVIVTNSLEGEPIGIVEPSDADDDSVADSDSLNTFVISYTDKEQVIRDLYWTGRFVGTNDSDELLEPGESYALTIQLAALADNTPLIVDTDFTLELNGEFGAVMIVTRRTPSVIDTVMNLN